MPSLYGSMVVIVVALSAPAAHACDCAPSDSPAKARERAELVFRATVVSSGERDASTDAASVLPLSFAVSRVWKGELGRALATRWRPPSVDMCAFPFEAGKEYLVYGRLRDDVFEASVCSRTRPFDDELADLKALGVGRRARGSERVAAKRSRVAIVIGESIAGVRLGMALAEVRKLGLELRPEGVDRAAGRGWQAGALLVIVDDAEVVQTVSLDLRRTSGISVGGVLIAAAAKLDEIAALLAGCELHQGSGGRALDCKNAQGRVTHFYDSYVGDEVSVVMP